MPARGGSKRIPRKNIREFSGQPLIAHAIGTALASGLFDRVVVSTDDDEVSSIARASGAEVPFRRPSTLSGDYTGTTEVISHAVNWLQDHGCSNLKAVCCIYPTAVFMCAEDLAEGLAILESADWHYVFSATEFAAPVPRSFERGQSGRIKMLFPEKFGTRSQDLAEVFHDAGQFYWGTPEAWLGLERIFDRHSTIIRIPRWRVQDIDTEEDWRRALCIATCMAELCVEGDGDNNSREQS
ncbi:MAG: pseudaminic acid cytidylyltransferase [Woeseiaceae bacterium]